MDSSGPKGTDASGNPILQVRPQSSAGRGTAGPAGHTAFSWQAPGPAARKHAPACLPTVP